MTNAVENLPDVPSQPCVEWNWNIDTHRMELDVTECQALFGSGFPSLSDNFILSCMSFDDQGEFIERMELAYRRKEEASYHCALYLNKGKISYVEFVFRPSDSRYLVGELYPRLSFPSSGPMLGALFRQLFDNPHRGIVIADGYGEILVVNQYFRRHTGYSSAQLIGQNVDVLNSGKHSDDFYQTMRVDIEKNGFWSGVILIKTHKQEIVPQELTVQKVVVRDRAFYIGYYLDLSNHLYRIADVEHGGVELLTQLSTEGQFTHAIANQWMDSAEDKVTMVLAFVPNFGDGDHFELKSKLSEHLARNPVSSHVGYIGNNHFVACLVCEKSGGPNQVRIIHQTIRKFFSELNLSSGKEMHKAIVTGKVGVSVLGHDTHTPKLLVTHAVQAMLEQGDDSKGLIAFYHGAIHREVLRRKELEDWAVKQITQQEIEVFYQPIVDVHSWDIVKFEALCRFRTPSGKLMNTQEMVTIAEDLDLISDLDWAVGVRALKDLNTIQSRYGNNIGLTINRSLNTKLEPEEVLQSAEMMIKEYAQTPHLVTIELTESAYFDSESRQSSFIKNLRQKGVSIAIDDFGTGYSSFAYLSDCNFDLLKIDREFVKHIKVGSSRYYIVKMITDLAHTLDVKVVAEGVESRHELEVLCSIGVDYIQGYFFSRPLSMDELDQAWSYMDKLEDYLERKSSVRGVGILSVTHTHVPCLEPQDTLEHAKTLFDSPNFNLEVIPILDGSYCVGIVDRACMNYHLSPTFGTKLETTADLKLKGKRMNQVMRTDIYRLSFQTKVTQMSELVRSGVKPPWVVEDEAGNYLGVVSYQDVLGYFASN
ncbi:EAL domain-containing protein [Vibrio sonorensis]|uniref:EAL domain-containing protein n=1 Tax=Vibrio sonorensis TaxID=1004316 RepID=UPI0008DA9822|nr:EAL domain-containing protein [Vibrio sonorensis]